MPDKVSTIDVRQRLGDLLNRAAAVSQDPDNEKYLAAAVQGRATFVVTGDPHLLAVSQYEGVRIVSPRAFLDLLGS